jgi:hypothetical protein
MARRVSHIWSHTALPAFVVGACAVAPVFRAFEVAIMRAFPYAQSQAGRRANVNVNQKNDNDEGRATQNSSMLHATSARPIILHFYEGVDRPPYNKPM